MTGPTPEQEALVDVLLGPPVRVPEPFIFGPRRHRLEELEEADAEDRGGDSDWRPAQDAYERHLDRMAP